MIEAHEINPHPAGMGGTQSLFKFDNGYGASVVCFPGSYGYRQGLYELAVIKWFDKPKEDGQRYNITYDSAITEDVLGHLSVDEVQLYLVQIEGL